MKKEQCKNCRLVDECKVNVKEGYKLEYDIDRDNCLWRKK